MLCWLRDEFLGWGARCYGEHAGHDLVVEITATVMDACRIRGPRGLLVDDMEPGDLIAIEGKLRGTPKVLAQALPPDSATAYGTAWSRRVGCDFYCVAVPDYPEGFDDVAAALGIGVFVVAPVVPGDSKMRWMDPGKPARIDRYIPPRRIVGLDRPKPPILDVVITPGLPSPMPLTGWKVGAVSLCILAQSRPLTRADFKHHGCDTRRFVDAGWMTCAGRGAEARWTLVDPAPGNRPDLWYKDVAAAVRARGVDAAGDAAGELFAAGSRC